MPGSFLKIVGGYIEKLEFLVTDIFDFSIWAARGLKKPVEKVFKTLVIRNLYLSFI